MRQFRFRLQILLKLRYADRQQRRSELAHALRAERALQDQWQAVTGELEAAKRQLRRAAEPGSVNVDRLLETHRFELVLQAQIRRLQQQLGQVREEIDRRRERLAEADQQVQTLEKLQEKQAESHQRALDKHEQALLDEVALRPFTGGTP